MQRNRINCKELNIIFHSTAMGQMKRFFMFFGLCFLTVNSLQAQQAKPQFLTDGKAYENLQEAFDAARDGSIVEIPAGRFDQAGTLKANSVTISGIDDKTILFDKTTGGKGLLVIKGNNTIIRNIECFGVQVSDKNGACVRLEGKNLELDRVYFHDSQQGLLTSSSPGNVLIRNSKFERLGQIGRAHGIYVGGGILTIQDSQFLSSRDEGHEIKSRAKETFIERTVVASLNGKDSRLIDIPNGGILMVSDSVLQQGNKTSNWNLIGYGQEGYKHKYNDIGLFGNIVIMDRQNGSHVLDVKSKKVKPEVSGNAFIGKHKDKFNDSNFVFATREDAKLPAYPFLPPIPK
jgi:hypothetical protein